jgi:hypothetical protein
MTTVSNIKAHGDTVPVKDKSDFVLAIVGLKSAFDHGMPML